jgi:hypothetical protein
MPSAAAITQAIAHYAPQLQAIGVLPGDVLLRLDAQQAPKAQFGSKKPGIPCGKGYISWRKKCGEDNAQAAQKRLKGTAEGKAYADRIRKSKGLKPGGAGKGAPGVTPGYEDKLKALAEGKAPDSVKHPRRISRKGEDFLNQNSGSRWMAKHEGVQAIAYSLDHGVPFNTGGYIGNAVVVKINKPSKSKRWGSATVRSAQNPKETENFELPYLADRIRNNGNMEDRYGKEQAKWESSPQAKAVRDYVSNVNKTTASPKPSPALKNSQKTFMTMNGKELKEYAQTLGITASNRTNRQLAEALERKTGKRSPRADSCACDGTTPKRKRLPLRLRKELLKMDARKCSPPWRGTLGSCTRGAEAGSKRSIANIARGGKMTPERTERRARIKALKAMGAGKSMSDRTMAEIDAIMSENDRQEKASGKRMARAEKKSAKNLGKQMKKRLKELGKENGLDISLEDLNKSDKMLENSARKLGIELPKIDPKKAMETTLESLMGKAAATNKAFDKTAKKAKGLKDMSLEELFKEADRVGSKYQDKPPTMEEALKAEASARSLVRQERLAGAAQGQIDRLTRLGKRAKDEPSRRKSAKQAAATKNAIRKFNRRADAMGWSTAVRMDAIALLLEVLN